MNEQKFIKLSESVFVDADFEQTFKDLRLTSIGAVFAFKLGRNMVKDNLAKYRSRTKFEIEQSGATFFMKRYDMPSIPAQIKNWVVHRGRKTFCECDLEPTKELAKVGLRTPKTVCYGQWMGMCFEKRSFIITEKIPDAESLEQKLPDYFDSAPTVENLALRRDFISQLATVIKKFHKTGYRHRDLYLCHIFYTGSGEFYLIDLARAFKPLFFGGRFRVKDLAQLYYSAPGKKFSRTDRLRFYLSYLGRNKLTTKDKTFISKVKRKAKRIARHDVRHGRKVPFKN